MLLAFSRISGAGDNSRDTQRLASKFLEQWKICAMERAHQWQAGHLCDALGAASVLGLEGRGAPPSEDGGKMNTGESWFFRDQLLPLLKPEALERSRTRTALLYPYLKLLSASDSATEEGETMERYCTYVRRGFWEWQLREFGLAGFKIQDAQEHSSCRSSSGHLPPPHRFVAEMTAILDEFIESNTPLSTTPTVKYAPLHDADGFLVDFWVSSVSRMMQPSTGASSQTKSAVFPGIAVLFHTAETTLHRESRRPLGMTLLRQRWLRDVRLRVGLIHICRHNSKRLDALEGSGCVTSYGVLGNGDGAALPRNG